MITFFLPNSIFLQFEKWAKFNFWTEKKCYKKAISCTSPPKRSLYFFPVQKLQKNGFWSKNFFREIAFLAVLNFFLVQKLIFGHFWNCKKWNLVKKNIREIDLFDFMSFLAWTFLNFLAHHGTTYYLHFSILKSDFKEF